MSVYRKRFHASELGTLPVSVRKRDESVELRAQPVGQRLGIGAQLLDRRDAEVERAGVGQGLDEQVDRGADDHPGVNVGDSGDSSGFCGSVCGSAQLR